MKTKPRTNCIVCEKPIFRGRSEVKVNRGDRAVTCSGKCSKIYTRVYKFIFLRIKK